MRTEQCREGRRLDLLSWSLDEGPLTALPPTPQTNAQASGINGSGDPETQPTRGFARAVSSQSVGVKLTRLPRLEQATRCSIVLRLCVN